MEKVLQGDIHQEANRPGNNCNEVMINESEPSLDEIWDTIKNLETGKAPGCNEITTEMIWAVAESSIYIYHTVF